MKMTIDLSVLCKEMPNEIQMMLEYTLIFSGRYARSLNFKQEPNYNLLLQHIRTAADTN
jgi:hypothetical protein